MDLHAFQVRVLQWNINGMLGSRSLGWLGETKRCAQTQTQTQFQPKPKPKLQTRANLEAEGRTSDTSAPSNGPNQTNKAYHRSTKPTPPIVRLRPTCGRCVDAEEMARWLLATKADVMLLQETVNTPNEWYDSFSFLLVPPDSFCTSDGQHAK